MKIKLKEKIILLVIAIGIFCYGFYNYFMVENISKINELNAKKAEVTGFATDITPLLEESEKLTKTRNELRLSADAIKTNEEGYTTTNEEFLKYLGEITEKNNVGIVNYKELSESDENGIYKLIVDFEIKGNEPSLNNVLSYIDQMKIKYSVGSVSIRQNEEYKYLKRFYDSFTELPWYNEPTEEELKEQEKLKEEKIEDILQEIPTIQEDVPVISEETVPENIPEEEPEQKEEETINERLNDLISELSLKRVYFNPTFVDNNLIGTNSEMKMAVTVCFVMFKEPSVSSSFSNTGDLDGIF